MKIEGIQARINQNGRIVIPAVIRKGMGLRLGDTVVLSLEDGILRLEPEKARARRAPAGPGRPTSGNRAESSTPVDLRRVETPGAQEDWLG